MRKIHYAGTSVLTGDQTCKAVLRLARALAIKGRSDIIEFPIVEEGGQVVVAHLLIGPASQIASTPVTGTDDEPNDFGVIEQLERRTRELQPARPVWDEEMTDVLNIDWDSDLLEQ
jgi:hypothetical protein